MGSLCDIAVCPEKLIITLRQLVKKQWEGFFIAMFMSGKNTEGNNLFYIEKNLRLEEKIAISFFSMRKVLEDKLSGIQWDLSKNFFSKKTF